MCRRKTRSSAITSPATAAPELRRCARSASSSTRRAARRSAARPIFIAPHTGRSLTFGELRDSCIAVSALLRDAWLQPGDHVSLVMRNGIQTIRLLLGRDVRRLLRAPGQSAVAAGADALRDRPCGCARRVRRARMDASACVI